MYATRYAFSATMYAMNDTSFSDWLEIEISKRGWSQAETARQAGVTRSAINGVLSKTRTAGNDLCEAIARAFKIPPEVVFRKAGLLPNKPEKDQLSEEAEYLFQQLPEYQRRQAIDFIRFLAEQKGDYVTETMEKDEHP